MVDVETDDQTKQSVGACVASLASEMVAQKEAHPALKRPEQILRMTVEGSPGRGKK